MTETANRRIYPRRLRRVQVRFSKDGEERSHSGFTKNLSVSGAFITTPDPANRGDRLHLVLMDGGRQTPIEALVVHSHRMPPELRRFADSAMGVRFLDLEELVGPLLPPDARQALAWPDEETAAESGGTESGPAEAESQPDPPTPPPARGVSPGSATAAAARSAPSSRAARPGTGPPPAARRPPVATRGGVYPLSFENPSDLVALYRRDVVNGGLFVATSRPAAVDNVVTVEVHVPGGRAPLRAEARVVQVVEPRPTAGGRTVGGMGLELRDPDKLIRELAPVVAELEGEA